MQAPTGPSLAALPTCPSAARSAFLHASFGLKFLAPFPLPSKHAGTPTSANENCCLRRWFTPEVCQRAFSHMWPSVFYFLGKSFWYSITYCLKLYSTVSCADLVSPTRKPACRAQGPFTLLFPVPQALPSAHPGLNV